MFQAYYLIDELDALHNVEVPLGYAGIKKAERREWAKEALIRVGLEDRLKYYPSQLSGGQTESKPHYVTRWEHYKKLAFYPPYLI